MVYLKRLIALIIISVFSNAYFSYSYSSSSSKFKPYKVTVIGTGYVGLVQGVCLAHWGHKVTCVDIDNQKVEKLKQGISPIYELGLDDLLITGIKNNNLSFTTDISTAIKDSEIIFIAVGTPMSDDGQADLSYVYSAAESISKNMNNYKVICLKSTTPVGTARIIKTKIAEYTNTKFSMIYNPEFLREGSAISDFFHPDRIVLGFNSKKALDIVKNLYKPLLDKAPVVESNLETAELIKYASNAFLATKISFINEIANFCECSGADIAQASVGIGLDKRIGSAFLNPGPGFGGSCFPKDIKALLQMGIKSDNKFNIIESVIKVNKLQKKRMVDKFVKLLGNDLKNKTVAVLGLAFKANTDDIRYSSAIDVIKYLLKLGVNIKAYDPMAMENMKNIFPDIAYATGLYDAAKDSDGIIILTEWKEFSEIDLSQISKIVRNKVLLDTRNILNIKELRDLGFKWDNIGNCNRSRLIKKN